MVSKLHAKGAAQQARGSVKAATGRMTGNTRLQMEGHADRFAGGLRRVLARIAARLAGK